MKKFKKMLIPFIFVLFFNVVSYATEYTFGSFVLNALFTALFFMTIPLILFFLGVEFKSKKGVIWFVILNSIITELLFSFIFSVSNIADDPNVAPAFLYGFLNYYILKNNISPSDKKINEKYELLINGISNLNFFFPKIYSEIIELNSYNISIQLALNNVKSDLVFLYELFNNLLSDTSDTEMYKFMKIVKLYIENILDNASKFIFYSETLLQYFMINNVAKSEEFITKNSSKDKEEIIYYYNRFKSSIKIFEDYLKNI